MRLTRLLSEEALRGERDSDWRDADCGRRELPILFGSNQGSILILKSLAKLSRAVAHSEDLNELEFIEPPLVLADIIVKTNELGFGMSSEPRTGAFLRTLAASKPNGRFLELGTGTGIATAWLLAGMDRGSKLISIDTDLRVQAVAKEMLGRDDRLELVLDDGITFLKSKQTESYDFVFADAMPGKYEGFDECLRVVRNGGFYVVDDMLPQSNWPIGHAEKIPVLISRLVRRKDFKVVPISWASGIVVAVRCNEH